MTTETLKDLTILYAEDDDAIKNNTIVTLQLVNATVIDASNGKEGLEKFIEHQYDIDIILTDISMPVMDGLEMIEEIKNIRSDIPILITTAHQDISYLKKAIELGVTSYILKPIDIRNIIKSIVKAMEPIQLKKELISKNEELIALNNSLEEKIQERTQELEKLASTDYLTGINNRRNFFILAKEKFDNTNSNLFAVMIDLDNFKRINDRYGHKVGDEILILTTKTIQENLKEEDIFGRIGGEEFAILFNCDNEKHIEKVDKLRKIVESIKYDDVVFTISLGIAQKLPIDRNIDMLLSRADSALYDAKGSGRNKLIFRER